jgi:ribosome-associated toxin RatA of RatAB toxin-antitoxin module
MTVYTQHHRLRFSAEQLFDLTADVDRFSEFMPWIAASSIRRRKDHTLFVEMMIAAGPLRERFFNRQGVGPPASDQRQQRRSKFDQFE